MPRQYTISFENVAVTTAQDLVSIKGATGKTIRPIRAWVGATDTTLPTAQMLQIRLRYATATITLGSVGAAGTNVATDQGDAAASFTSRINDTTKATTSGSFLIVEEAGCHIYAGYDNGALPRIPIGVNEGFVFELLSTVSGTVHLSGGLLVEETGG